MATGCCPRKSFPVSSHDRLKSASTSCALDVMIFGHITWVYAAPKIEKTTESTNETQLHIWFLESHKEFSTSYPELHQSFYKFILPLVFGNEKYI